MINQPITEGGCNIWDIHPLNTHSPLEIVSYPPQISTHFILELMDSQVVKENSEVASTDVQTASPVGRKDFPDKSSRCSQKSHPFAANIVIKMIFLYHNFLCSLINSIHLFLCTSWSWNLLHSGIATAPHLCIYASIKFLSITNPHWFRRAYILFNDFLPILPVKLWTISGASKWCLIASSRTGSGPLAYSSQPLIPFLLNFSFSKSNQNCMECLPTLLNGPHYLKDLDPGFLESIYYYCAFDVYPYAWTISYYSLR